MVGGPLAGLLHRQTHRANGVIDQDRSKATPDGARINPGIDLVPEEDIEFGTWDPVKHTWTPIPDTGKTVNDPRRAGNAIHVTGRRIKERNHPIPLIFAPVIGQFSTDINRDAIAYISGSA